MCGISQECGGNAPADFKRSIDMHKRQFRFTSWFVAAVITICGIATLAPRVAWAHAVLVSAQPGENSTVAGPDVAVLLKYNSRVDMAAFDPDAARP